MPHIGLGLLAALASLIEPTSRYEECIAHVTEDVPSGRAEAQAWAEAGGGADAQHCLAVADLAAGFPKLAAARLEDIAQRKDAGDDYIRARLLAQAAEAWLEVENTDYAEKAIKSAFNLVPDADELNLTAARVYAAKKNWPAAIASVDVAEASGFVAADTYVIRGRGRVAQGDYRAAADDVVNALTLDPTNLDALVLRGEIQQTGITIDVFLNELSAEE